MIDDGISKVGQILLCVIAGVFVLGLIFTYILPADGSGTVITQNDLVVMDKDIDGLRPMPQDVDKVSAPYFTVEGAILDIHDSFDFTQYIVRCESRDGQNLRPYVNVSNPVKPGVIGTYNVSFILHWNGREIVKTTEFRVTDKSNYQ